MNFLNFLQGPNAENSSKRLAGISAMILALTLSLLGGIFLLKHNQIDDFLSLVNSLFLTGGTLLGLGIADNFFKKDSTEKSEEK